MTQRQIKGLHVLAVIVALSYSPAAAAETKVQVPSDPKASYYVLEKTGSAEQPIVVTKRVGQSGTSFAKRKFDCRARTFMYLAEGDTLAELRLGKSAGRMSVITDQSITYYIWKHACGK